jgi:hypothetical protein
MGRLAFNVNLNRTERGAADIEASGYFSFAQRRRFL